MALKILKHDPLLTHVAKVDSAATVLEGQLVGLDSDGEWVLADKDSGPVKAFGVALKDGAGSAADYIAASPIALVGGFSSLTPGAVQYLSGTAGGVTASRPATAADVIQPVGMAVTATKIAFNVAPPFAVIQSTGNSTIA